MAWILLCDHCKKVLKDEESCLRTLVFKNSFYFCSITCLYGYWDKNFPMNAPIDSLPLTVRSLNCLTSENVYFLSDLLKKTERQLLYAPNLGRKSLNEIKEVLSSMGYSLKEEENSNAT